MKAFRVLTLEEESTGLLDGGGGHSEPHDSVGAHELCPQSGLHLGVEGRHGGLDGCRENKSRSQTEHCLSHTGDL